MNYYDRPELSNSDLTALARMYNALPDNREELEDVFNFGSLVDAMLSERHRVDFALRELTEDGGRVIRYSPAVFTQAERLATLAKRDPVIRALVENAVGQYVFIRTIVFDFEGEEYAIKSRCKFDAYARPLAMGADYKTTACTSYNQFKNAISHFHWDRQAAFYMDLARIDRHWIIGISKKTGQIFKHAIERDDETYKVGRAKYCYWAAKWATLIQPFALHATEKQLI